MYKRQALLLAVLLAVLLTSTFAWRVREQPLEVRTKVGSFHGLYKGGAREFLGIPYAQPPVGDLRFAAPVPASSIPHNTVYNATNWAPFCVQDQLAAGIPQSEDCLYLNVFTPRYVKNARKLPVMVFIHGGRLLTGDTKMFEGDILAEQGEVIVVTMAYRLNIFGFFTLPEVGSLNNGFLDQQLALKWINKNIDAFGGDKDRVMIFGESAGATSVLFHLLSPASFPLYDRAALLSVWGWKYPTTQQTINTGLAWAASKGCSGTPSEVMQCMRSLPASTILPKISGSHHFVINVENEMFPEQPLPMLRKGQFNTRVPINMGYTKNEGWFMAYSRGGWVHPSVGITYEKLVSATNSSLNVLHNQEEILASLEWYEDYRQQHGNWETLAVLLGNYYIQCGSHAAAYYFQQHSRKPFYTFVWDYVSANYPEPFLLAAHGNELPYVFGHICYTPYEFTEDDNILAQRMISSFSSMAYTGSPRDCQTDWDSWTPRRPYAYLWQQPSSSSPAVAFTMTPMCENWIPLFDPAAYQ